jgi:hypothetical protein
VRLLDIVSAEKRVAGLPHIKPKTRALLGHCLGWRSCH